nr:C-type lectin domain family 4 member G-like [Crassostrea gigas]
MKLCKLLRCRPTDKLVNKNLVGIPSGWELLEDTEACKSGWALFAGHCYYYSTIGTTWNKAEAFCNGSSASLIEIYSQTEEDWIKNSFLLPETGVKIQCPRYWSCSLWIGASRNPITSNFLYNSGKPILHPKWGLFQPGNEIGNENCGLLLRSGKLHDAGCIFSDFHYICKTKNDVV